jgi:hypothetical protein
MSFERNPSQKVFRRVAIGLLIASGLFGFLAILFSKVLTNTTEVILWIAGAGFLVSFVFFLLSVPDVDPNAPKVPYELLDRSPEEHVVGNHDSKPSPSGTAQDLAGCFGGLISLAFMVGLAIVGFIVLVKVIKFAWFL